MKKIQFVIVCLMVTMFMQAKGQVKTVVHTVESGQTIYSIARAYQQKPEDIKRANPNLDEQYTIKPGQVLMIILPDVAPPTTTSQQLMKDSVEHIVVKDDTLYSLSKYYQVGIDDLKKWNKLSDNSIQLGQSIIVGYNYSNKFSSNDDVIVLNPSVTKPVVPVQTPEQPVVSEKATVPPTEVVVYKADENGNIVKEVAQPQNQTQPQQVEPVVQPVATPKPIEQPVKVTKPVLAPPKPARKLSKQEQLRNKYKQQKNVGSFQQKEGSAIWIVSKNRMMNATYYGMFSEVPVGTVVKVENLNNGRSVYVKIIGSLPNTKENTGALIKLTPAVQKVLKTSDAKVRVKVSYAN